MKIRNVIAPIVFPFNDGRAGVRLDVYDLANDDLMVVEVTDVGFEGVFALLVGTIRPFRLPSLLTGVEKRVMPYFFLNDLNDPSLGFVFIAELAAQQVFNAPGDIFFGQVAGNALGNYNPVNGAYTFSDPFDGTFTFEGTITDDAGSGGSTVELTSSIQGVLASQVYPNNTTTPAMLTFTGSFVAGEIVSVFLDTSAGSVAPGAKFELN